MNAPSHRCCQRDQWTYHFIPCCRSKCLFIVDAFLLREAPSHKYCFIFINTSIYYMFDLLDPFGIYHRFVSKPMYDLPNSILHHKLIFFIHGILPFFVIKNFLESGWLCFYLFFYVGCCLECRLGFLLSLNVPWAASWTSASTSVDVNQLGLFLVSWITIGCIGSLGPSSSWFDYSCSLISSSSNTGSSSSSDSWGDPLISWM